MSNLDINIDINSLESSEVEKYVTLFFKEKRSDQLLAISRIFDMSPYLSQLDLSKLDELKCVANTLKLYGSHTYYAEKIDLKVVDQLHSDHLFVIFRIFFLATTEYHERIRLYGVALVEKIYESLDCDKDDVLDECLKCLYNLLNFYDLVQTNDKERGKLFESKNISIPKLYEKLRRLVLNETHTSHALNALLHFKDFLASELESVMSIENGVALYENVYVEKKDKILIDFLINYLDTKFTHDNEVTGTVFGIIAYLFTWMCTLEFKISSLGKQKPWRIYLKEKLLPDDVDRAEVLGAGISLPHRLISAFSATAGLGITKEEVGLISEGQVRPPPMTAFTSERIQELVFSLFDQQGNCFL
eukprot:NODE_90_length_21577_cov_0.697691.p7 type:complete len:360 gc:universal NODE_90_length_21577_cov_0.697691:20597-19518(-)